MNTSYDAIDAYIEAQMHRLHIPGLSLVIVDGDEMVHFRGFGRARPGGEAPTLQTPFFIGSVTKSFTALAVMQMVEAGKVNLDAPIQRYLPWFRVANPHDSTQMTVRHLLNQTSGLPLFPSEAALADLDNCPDAAEHQARALSTQKLSRPVGSKFEYSNTNYNLLGLIVESASDESYADYVQNHIFKPLEMTHSYTSPEVAKQNSLAMGHRYWFGKPFPDPKLSIPLGSLPSGQLISSAEDMAHYLIAFLNGGCYRGTHILSEAGICEMTHGAAEWKEMGFLIGHYGMGWINQDFDGIRIISHSGIVPNFGAFAAILPEQKKGIVLLYNANHAMMKLTLDEMGMGAARRLTGTPPSKNLLGGALWLLRGMAFIPLLQMADVFLTHRWLDRWRAGSASQPTRSLLWKRHILFPLVPNLMIAFTLLPVLGKMRGWMLLFMTDFSWIAKVCGSFSLVWSFSRTGLIIKRWNAHNKLKNQETKR